MMLDSLSAGSNSMASYRIVCQSRDTVVERDACVDVKLRSEWGSSFLPFS